MATLRDWLNLASNTVQSLETRQITDLYSQEWPETRRRLTAEHQEAIDRERKRYRRVLRTGSAILYGVTKRLAPQRRLLFVAALVVLFWSTVAVWMRSHHGDLFWAYVGLSAAFIAITLLLGMELIDKIKYRDELELARQLQSELIPKKLPEVEGFQLAAFNHIANTVGGDIYDFIPLPDGRLAVLFGDASGHGMAAGLIMAVAHATFRTQLEVDPSPRAVFTTLNRILCATGGSRSFFAGVYLLLHPDGEFEVCVAGHPPLLQIDSRGAVRGQIGSGSYPLGIKRDYAWVVERGALERGDALVIYSDGLPESRTIVGEEFGEERIESICRWSAGRPASELVSTMVAQWQMFVGRCAVEDDVSVAVIRRDSHAVSAAQQA